MKTFLAVALALGIACVSGTRSQAQTSGSPASAGNQGDGGILHMTTRTVAYHKYRIMEVLGARSNAELVKYAVRNHMVAA